MPEKQETTGRGEEPGDGLTGRQQDNLSSDAVTDINVRPKDNVVQALTIIVCLAFGAGVGAVVRDERVVGALVGGVIGLIVGCFGSGIALMIYRIVMRARGRHD